MCTCAHRVEFEGVGFCAALLSVSFLFFGFWYCMIGVFRVFPILALWGALLLSRFFYDTLLSPLFSFFKLAAKTWLVGLKTRGCWNVPV